jgi:hypothetical protein
MKKVFIVISIIIAIVITVFIVYNLKDRFIHEEIITSKNEGERSSFYSNMNEYEYERLNKKIEFKNCFSYEEIKTNRLYVKIHNKSDYFFNDVDVYVIYYENDKVIYIEREDIYGIITPRNTQIVDLGFIPAKTTRHDIIIMPSNVNEKYKDMSDYIKTDIIKKNKDYYCKVENKSELKIENCYIQMIFYDKDNKIIDIESEGFYDINSKKTQQKEIYSLRDFDHYETIINAYYYD